MEMIAFGSSATIWIWLRNDPGKDHDNSEANHERICSCKGILENRGYGLEGLCLVGKPEPLNAIALFK